MKLDNKHLDELSEMVYLKFSDDEKKYMLNDLNNILLYIEKLETINTDGVTPLVNIIQTEMDCYDKRLRKDISTKPLSHTQVLANAPKKDLNYFRSPKTKNLT